MENILEQKVFAEKNEDQNFQLFLSNSCRYLIKIIAILSEYDFSGKCNNKALCLP